MVTRTPASEVEKHFLVRFPDGFEASLTRQQLDVLKHFKDRIPGLDAPPGFELEQFIIYRCVVGSRAYGLDNDDSDTDRPASTLRPPNCNGHSSAHPNSSRTMQRRVATGSCRSFWRWR